MDDELLGRLRRRHDEAALWDLTAIVGRENLSGRVNRALRVPSQDLWRLRPAAWPGRP